MKATELLQKQHRDIEALLNKLRAAGQGDETEIKNELAAVLVAHTTIEQESFYPSMQAALPEEIAEAKEEHALADVELARLLVAGADDEDAEARVSVLSDVVLRHIRREETDIFKVADRELGEDALIGLADTMTRRFRQIVDGDYPKMLQKALDQAVPRIAAPSRRGAKKTARRAAAGKKAKTGRRAGAAAAPKRAPTRRAPTKRGQSATSRKGKSTRSGAGGTSRTRGTSGGTSRAGSGSTSRSRA